MSPHTYRLTSFVKFWHNAHTYRLTSWTLCQNFTNVDSGPPPQAQSLSSLCQCHGCRIMDVMSEFYECWQWWHPPPLPRPSPCHHCVSVTGAVSWTLCQNFTNVDSGGTLSRPSPCHYCVSVTGAVSSQVQKKYHYQPFYANKDTKIVGVPEVVK